MNSLARVSKETFNLAIKEIIQERFPSICIPFIRFSRGQRPKARGLSIVSRVCRCIST